MHTTGLFCAPSDPPVRPKRAPRAGTTGGPIEPTLSRLLAGASLLLALCVLPSCGKKSVTGPDGGGPGGEPPATAPTALFGMSASSGVAPMSISFTDRSTGTIETYSWAFGDGATSSERNPSHSYNKAGAYTATLTVSGPGGTNSVSHVISVDEIITWDFHLNAHAFTVVPIHTLGDCEFGGHGPAVTCRATASISSDQRSVNLDVYMRAQETQADWTTAEGTQRYGLLTYGANAGIRVKEIYGPAAIQIDYTDTNHDVDSFLGSSFGTFSAVGDTDGNDVCNTTGDYTHATFYLRYLRFRVGP